MRHKYPIYSDEFILNINSIQDSLLSLIGYDENSFDNSVQVSGIIGVMEAEIGISGGNFINDRLYNNAIYSIFYKQSLITYHSRSSIND